MTGRPLRPLMTALASLALGICLLGCEQRVEGTQPGDCSDGADNDADGAFDCKDDGCKGAPVCERKIAAAKPASIAVKVRERNQGGIITEFEVTCSLKSDLKDATFEVHGSAKLFDGTAKNGVWYVTLPVVKKTDVVSIRPSMLRDKERFPAPSQLQLQRVILRDGETVVASFSNE